MTTMMNGLSLDDGAFAALPGMLDAILRQGPPPLTASDIDTMYGVGVDLYARGKWSDAQDVFRLLILCRPTHARSWIALAACHEAQGEEDRALSLYRVAATGRSRPNARLAQLYLARLLLRLGRMLEAHALVDTLALEPTDDTAFVALYQELRRWLALPRSGASETADTEPSLQPIIEK